ncbi:TonB-dependent receptor, partial [Nostoc sp. 3335mG]
MFRLDDVRIASAIGTRTSTALRTGASALALALLAAGAPAWAQEASQPAEPQDQAPPEAAGDEIIVQGYRQSLQSAQSIKRNSDVIVDSVTAEDIGALPDRSVTETLQRIPGVTINRFAAGVDPDHFSVEGSGVVVRGLTYVRSEFNGREAFSANNGRSLSFADVPSEMLGGVDVFKSPSADRIEGGIAGVVNLRTRLPFDAKGLVVAGSVELNYGDFLKKTGPNLSLVVSNRWQTGIGEFGLLGSASYSNLKSRADRLQVSSFRIRNLYSDGDVNANDGTTVAGRVIFPRGAVIGSQEFDRERYGYSAAAQWRSNDGSAEAVLQFLRSDARQAWNEHTIEIATDNVSNNGDSRRVPGTTLNFDEDGMFQSGTITGPTGWRADQNTGAARVPMLGLQSNNIARFHDEKLVTDDLAFNFKWTASDRLALSFDYQHVNSSTYVADHTLWNSTYQNASIALNGDKYPTIAFLPPQVCSGPAANSQDPPGGDFDCAGFGSRAGENATPGAQYSPAYYGAGHTSFTDPFNSFARAAMDHLEDSKGNSDAFRLDLDYTFPDDSFIKSIRAGVRYADRDQVARFSTYNWGRLSEQWGNDGPVWLDDPVDNVIGGTGGTAIGLNANAPYYFSNFMRGKASNPAADGRQFYASNIIQNYSDYVAYASAINREWEATNNECPDGLARNGGWNPLALRCDVVAGTPFLPGEINPIREQNKAAYIMARFDQEFGNGMRLTGNIGVRYSNTKRNSQGVKQFTRGTVYLASETTCLTPPTDGSAAQGFCTFDAATRQRVRNFQNGALLESPGESTLEYWLPSFNAKLEVGGGLQFRAAYFKGVAPPATGLIRNFGDIRVNAVQNTNPDGTLIPDSWRLQADINQGNPFLKPVEADNFDLTAEWYFSNVGQLTFSGFYKRLKNVLTNETRRSTITNNGETFDALITNPANATETGTIKGFEIAYQQTFDFLPGPLKGLGLQANYTFVDSQGVPQSTLSETDPDVGAGRVTTVRLETLPLQGLSKHSFNITPFFDYGPLSLRATYSWRSDFLLTIRDVIVPNDPIINKATGQLDASVFVNLTSNIKLGIQGSNLLNEVVKTKAVITGLNGENVEVPRGWYMNDRRVAGIIRFN